MDLAPAFEAPGQRLTTVSVFLGWFGLVSRLACLGVRSGVDSGCFQDLTGEQQELVGIELFGPAARRSASGAFRADAGGARSGRSAGERFQKLADELMGGVQVVRE